MYNHTSFSITDTGIAHTESAGFGHQAMTGRGLIFHVRPPSYFMCLRTSAMCHTDIDGFPTVICTGTGDLGKERNTGKNITGADVKGMIMKEAKEKEDIEKGGNASSTGRGSPPCLRLSRVQVTLTLLASFFVSLILRQAVENEGV